MFVYRKLPPAMPFTATAAVTTLVPAASVASPAPKVAPAVPMFTQAAPAVSELLLIVLYPAETYVVTLDAAGILIVEAVLPARLIEMLLL
jgi:hypothetical protein